VNGRHNRQCTESHHDIFTMHVEFMLSGIGMHAIHLNPAFACEQMLQYVGS
jgi:hypothetical protein